MGNRKLRCKLAIVNIIAVASISFGVMPAATANGVDLTGNYKCSDGTLAPDGYDPFQTLSHLLALKPSKTQLD